MIISDLDPDPDPTHQLISDLDPDPGSLWKVKVSDPYGSGSATLLYRVPFWLSSFPGSGCVFDYLKCFSRSKRTKARQIFLK